MIIRKSFKVESCHIVRNCTTDKCSKSLHGHSSVIEVFLWAKHLDGGGMVMDFSLLKKEVGDLIDSFDHSCLLWTRDNSDFKRDMKEWSDRWIELPMTPSAECLSIQLFYLIDLILKNTEFKNNEDMNLSLHSVRYHETTTGYAEAFREDIPKGLESHFFDFSDAIVRSWDNPHMFQDIIERKKFINPQPNQQV